MSKTADRYRRLSEDFATTVASIGPDGWDNRSPCEDWSARQLVQHMVDTQTTFLGFIGKHPSPPPSIDDDPVSAWNHARAAVQAELDDPERATATFQGMSETTTFESAVDRFLCTDLVVHRWDLARSQGKDIQIDAADMDHVDAAMEGLADKMRGPGAFGPELEAPPGADRQTSFLAYFGRRA